MASSDNEEDLVALDILREEMKARRQRLSPRPSRSPKTKEPHLLIRHQSPFLLRSPGRQSPRRSPMRRVRETSRSPVVRRGLDLEQLTRSPPSISLGPRLRDSTEDLEDEIQNVLSSSQAILREANSLDEQVLPELPPTVRKGRSQVELEEEMRTREALLHELEGLESRFRSEHDMLQLKLQRLTTERDRLKKQVRDEEESKVEMKNELNEANDTVKQLQRTVAGAISAKENAIHEAERERKAYLLETRRVEEDLRKEVVHLSDELQQLNTEKQVLMRDIAHGESQLENETKRKDRKIAQCSLFWQILKGLLQTLSNQAIEHREFVSRETSGLREKASTVELREEDMGLLDDTLNMYKERVPQKKRLFRISKGHFHSAFEGQEEEGSRYLEELEDLEARYSRSASQLSDQIAQADAYREFLIKFSENQIQRTVNDCSRRIQVMEEEVASVQQDLEGVRGDANESRRKSDELARVSEDLRRELRRAQEAHEQLKVTAEGERETYIKEVVRLEGTIADLENDKRELELSLSDRKQDIEQLNREKTAAGRERDELKAAKEVWENESNLLVKEAREKVNLLEEEIARERGNTAHAGAELQRLRDDLRKVEQQYHDLKKTSEELQHELRDRQNEKQEALKSLEEMKLATDRLAEEANRFKQENVVQKEEIENSKLEIDRLRVIEENASMAFVEEKEALISKSSRLEGELTTTRNEMFRLSGEIQNLKEAYRYEIFELENKAEESKTAAEDAHHQVVLKEKEAEKLRTDRDSITTKVHQLKDQLDQGNQVIMQLTKDKTQLLSQLQATKKDLAQAEVDKEELWHCAKEDKEFILKMLRQLDE